MKVRVWLPPMWIGLLLLVGCFSFPVPPTATPTMPPQATIIAAVDLGAGGAGFTSVVYAQEVHTGKTFHTIMSASSHGLVVLPTSAPVSFTVDAPGTYVFYAVLINESSYHFASTEFKSVSDCTAKGLVARDVQPGGTY